ncbi:MAG: PIN domain nuclease [Oscillospiraceae bacterium]|jgi:hypothetical protein|nr:PIN domain nuclease [Oscillospiraceae bacterium]
MRKQKIYLDTSVISCLFASETPDRQVDTREFWKRVKNNEFEVVLSDVTQQEIDDCPMPKKEQMTNVLLGIAYTKLSESDGSLLLSQQYIERGALPPKCIDDALHLAIATLNSCDIVVSWNFKHLSNDRARSIVTTVNIENGYKPLQILPPFGV